MNYKVTFEIELDSLESEEQAYDVLLEYLSQCVNNEDVTMFEFNEISKDKE